MRTIIIVKNNRQVTVSNNFIGYESEKNVGKIELFVPDDHRDLEWYMVFNETPIPFVDSLISIDDRLTSERGVFTCRILGSDGSRVSTSEHVFISDEFDLEVR